MVKSYRKILPLFMSLSAITLAGCNDVVTPARSDSIILNHDMLTMFVGETEQLGIEFTPVSKESPNFEFTSTNSEVATVNEKGLITAIAPGTAVISVKDVNTKVEQKMSISVDASDYGVSGGKKVATAIKKYHKDKGTKVKKAYIKERYKYGRYKEEVLQNQTDFNQDMIISEDDAFFFISSIDKNIKTENGNIEYSYSSWTIYTTDDYNTFLFHEQGVTKNYLIVDTKSVYTKGGSKYDALLEILDNLFTSGSDLITSELVDIVGTTGMNPPVDYVKSASKVGSRGDGCLAFQLSESYDTTADVETEQDQYIPFGTPMKQTVDIRLQWKDYFCINKVIDQKDSFSLDEIKYYDKFHIEYAYDINNVEIKYPNIDEYIKVNDIFEL